MAKAHPGINNLTRYLQFHFAWKNDYVALMDNGEKHTYTYQEVKEAMIYLRDTDPGLYRITSYRWQTTRSRATIADSLYLDSSTVKRLWDKGLSIMQNYLTNKDMCSKLDPLDLSTLCQVED